MKKLTLFLFMVALAFSLVFQGTTKAQIAPDPVLIADATALVNAGRKTFRFDTFGDQDFWGRTLKLHLAIKGAALGGVGPGLSPAAALGVGLKVDVDFLPAAVVEALQAGQVNLNDPAVTVQLLKLKAVVGLTGIFDAQNNLKSIGIQCALCHSQVDDSLAPGIGRRLDGWANRDLNVGAIIALAPNLQPFIDLLSVVGTPVTITEMTGFGPRTAVVQGPFTDAQVRAIFNGWGPGKFDATMILDGKTTNPFTGGSSATLIPPIFGLAGVNLHTFTGWGSVPYWNAFVGILEMGGFGTFFDPRLNNAGQFPIAAAKGFGNTRKTPDLVTSKLAALNVFQLALKAPVPLAGSFDAAAAARGKVVFDGKGTCARCHVPPLFTEPGWNLHTPAEIGIDAFQADRSPDHRYRTTPLKGLWTHTKGGFYHDGRFADLLAVVNHYDTFLGLLLTPQEKADLVQYLLSL